MIPTAKLAQKRAKLRAKLDGTMIQLRWVEWPDGKPDADPTSGAAIETDDEKPVDKSASVRAFIHFVGPVTSGFRVNSEVQTGMAIVDFPLDILRITDAGDTTLADGDVVDEISFSRANRDVVESAVGTVIEPSSLESISMVFAGHTWVQEKVGEELAKNWDTLYAGLNINSAMLMRKA